jgi:NADP-dependent 3-hydroxy acid dehydrogenase YdfG
MHEANGRLHGRPHRHRRRGLGHRACLTRLFAAEGVALTLLDRDAQGLQHIAQETRAQVFAVN